MRDLVLDEVAIRTYEPRDRDVFIKNTQIQAFSDEGFCQRDQRAFPKIVGTGLESQTEHRNLPSLQPEHRLDASFHLVSIARHQRIDQGQIDIGLARFVHERPYVFRQA